ncbi:histone H1.3-like [Heterodontus francisci]|uniref:histone H1.3-like n=1 Tax=Heterodontus francisci TaxID=7792 RepID=UPI00355C80D8
MDTAVSETAPPAAPAAQVKAAKKKKKVSARSKAPGPKLRELVLQVVAADAKSKGMSAPAIRKALGNRGVNVAKLRVWINLAIRRHVDKGTLVQTKGKGASSTFKLPKEKTGGNVTKAGKKLTTKKLAVKKPAAAKKPASKRSPAKKPAKKSPAKRLVRKSPAKKAGPKKAKKAAAGQKKAPAKKARSLKKTKAVVVKSGAGKAKGPRQLKTPKAKKAVKKSQKK